VVETFADLYEVLKQIRDSFAWQYHWYGPSYQERLECGDCDVL
jgi:hypothetical protein